MTSATPTHRRSHTPALRECPNPTPTRTSTRTRSLARSLARSLTPSLLHAPGQAIALIDQLTTLHGYASTGESLTIADPDEIWCGG